LAHKACSLDVFFEQHREQFARIKAAIDSINGALRTQQLQDFSRVIGLALNDPTMLLNYRTGCKLLGDAIIAVDSLDFSNFATQNYKDSQVLTKALDQRCYYLPNAADQAVEFQDLDDTSDTA
jgi:hypothetical protein